jgi:hypothetical protein
VADQAISLLTSSERSQSGLAGFSYSLDKNQGGTCSFLTEDKKCRVHDTAKPVMCKLFPYTFMHCPDGLRVGLSFASTGVLLNSGAPLLDQEPLLRELGELFDTMHPDLARSNLEKWSRSEFVAGALLDWDNFMDYSEPYLSRLAALIAPDPIENLVPERSKNCSGDTAQAVLSDMFDVLCQSLPVEMLSPLGKRFPHLAAEDLDQFILMPLYRAYLRAEGPIMEDEIAQAVMTYLQNEKKELYFKIGDRKITFAELRAVEIDPLTGAEQDLINRFVYVRLFARLYFGPGFSMMPLLSGIFHLTTLVVIVSLALKIDALTETLRQPPVLKSSDLGIRFERVLALVREIDRRLTAVIYSRNTSSMFELFALDPERVRRFLVLAN